MLTRALVQTDIKEFLGRLSDAIEQDQIYVDSLPRDRFPSVYDDGLWRNWRRGHRAFIDKLVASTDAMSPALLQRLTKVASGFEPSVVGHIMLETFAEIVGDCSAANCETAQHFFEWVAGEVVRQGRGKCLNRTARKAMLKWFPATDPLTIAQDPECGYTVPGPRVRSRRGTRRPAV
ncbi:hypothetical protein [Bradyrhizobium arachidis]|uniref:hypothetical protein n=1 Tax=Bradyrhizobium arachidis TaxID=858423 RepID=UPI002163B6D7|nr:hypothetical protein [Bradyrhizobium arachidis]UVO26949.1 hypothetical protein KUF59_31000 [Bradyrhizobium arachidis]